MDFDSMTTDELSVHFPQSEDNRWEFKDADYLTKAKRGSLDDELGKQVSAFSNTGGGYLVFGVENKTKIIQTCEQLVERTSMKDFLTTKVSSSVEYPISNFRVHRIPFTNDPAKAVYVISIPDSPAAPHQAKKEKRYYWRLDGSSEPAPHFHLELLRNRFTKSVLEIEQVGHTLRVPTIGRIARNPFGDEIETELRMSIDVLVRNTSLYSAESWGVHVSAIGTSEFWRCLVDPKLLSQGVCIRGIPDSLLPDESVALTIELSNTIKTLCETADDHKYHVMGELTGFALLLRPVSQNHVGSDFHFGCCKSYEENNCLLKHFMSQMSHDGCNWWDDDGK